ncbi:MAG: leucyl/phenylalanyl-tRNA--protein transferase [Bacteroidetes bacterium]|nr:leucyl/phenylalanyl-tRNA--protein transferase [Bacteroidota bacterium]
MPIFALDKDLWFPPPHLAEPDGVLAIGGDLTPGRLLLAYRHGIFPWYEDGPIVWWCPDPRMVLFPDELKISKSMRPIFNKAGTTEGFRFSVNTAFAQVIHACKTVLRPGQESTWITDEVERAYIRMHSLGHAHSAEVWKDDELVGGLYGIRMGRVFFGESMFSLVSNASRFAFIQYVQLLKKEGVALIDCQVQTDYLESMGARMIDREEFLLRLKELIP